MALNVWNPDQTRIVIPTKIDIAARTQIPAMIHLVQYDDRRPVIAVSVLQNGLPYAVPQDLDVNISFNKRDHKFVKNPALGCDETRTIVYFEATQQMCVIVGTFYPVVEFVTADNKVGSSQAFGVIVERNPISMIDIQNTTEYKSAKQYAEAAEASAQSANESKEAAASSAAAAAVSASEAKNSEDAAKASEEAALASQNAAKVSEDAAKESQTAAKESQDASKDSEEAAEASKNAAATSEANAKESEEAAEASKNAAATSETNAQQSEEAAAESQTQAAASAEAASASEANAKDSEKKAAASAEAAATSETNAETYMNAASESATAAASSETNAANSASEAEDWSNLSKSYAIGEGAPEQHPNEATDNSKYYSEQAKSSAQVVEKHSEAIEAIQENLDAVLGAAGNAVTAQTAAQEASDSAAIAKEAADRAQSIAQGALGYYASPETLKADHAEGENGQWAIIGETDTIWVWDSDNSEWTDSGQKMDLSNYYDKTQVDDKLSGKQDNLTLPLSVENGGTGNATGTAQYFKSHDIGREGDLNNCTTDGFYYVAGVNSVMNKPDNVDYFGLIVCHGASSLISQVLIAGVDIYVRISTANSWSPWRHIYSDHYHPTASRLATARSLGVDLARTDASIFDGAADQLEIPVKGILGPSNGGIGTSTSSEGTSARFIEDANYTYFHVGFSDGQFVDFAARKSDNRAAINGNGNLQMLYSDKFKPTATDVGLGNVTNAKQMPIAGGTFTGNAIAYSTNRNTACLRNTEVRITSATGTLQSTNCIIMVRV